MDLPLKKTYVKGSFLKLFLKIYEESRKVTENFILRFKDLVSVCNLLCIDFDMFCEIVGRIFYENLVHKRFCFKL